MAEFRSALVERVLAEEKYFPVRLDDICHLFEHGHTLEFTTSHPIQQPPEEDLDVLLRMRIGGFVGDPVGWDISLVMQSMRIDGFGFEPWFVDIDGKEQCGWHRHIWLPSTGNANGKSSVKLFDVADLTFQKFLLWSLREMRILWSGGDGDGQLLID